MHYSLVPSLPAKNWSELVNLFTALKGVTTGFQVDIVDGKFVRAISWPFSADNVNNELLKLSPYAKDFELEVDCMVEEPQQYLDYLVRSEVRRVIAHYGSTDDWQSLFSHRDKFGYLLGLAFTNDIDLSLIEPLVAKFDFVQVMGIAEVGKQGQPFDERTLSTITTLRAAHPELEIAVDGSVNATTIPLLKKAGANRFAPGSAIAKAGNPAEAYKQLVNII